MENVKVNWSKFDLKNTDKKGVIVVLMYIGKGDPKPALDAVVSQMVQGCDGFFEMIDANQDNPWTRVLMTSINNMRQENYNPTVHNLKKLLDE